MQISIVTTLYNSAPFLHEFYNRIKKEVEAVTSDYQIVMVNDGSPDQSLSIAETIAKKDKRVEIVDLSRNFGHLRAMMTGLTCTKGDYVFLIDCDLEEQPELFGVFYRKMLETSADVVYGVQKRRKGKFFEKISGGIFYTFFNWLSSEPVPANAVTAKLMTKRFVNNLILHQERELCFVGLMQLTGFKQIPVAIEKLDRGSSNYNLKMKFKEAVNAITSFSNKPLIFIFYLGMTVIFCSALYLFQTLYRKYAYGVDIEGWTSLIISVWFLGGLSLFCIGIIGIYLSKIFIETKQRPYSIVREHYKYSDSNEEKRILS